MTTEPTLAAQAPVLLSCSTLLRLTASLVSVQLSAAQESVSLPVLASVEVLVLASVLLSDTD